MNRGIGVMLVLCAAAVAAFARGEETMDGGTKPVEVGAKAPDFRLNDHGGRAVRLSEVTAAGKWAVLAFFPRAMTPG